MSLRILTVRGSNRSGKTYGRGKKDMHNMLQLQKASQERQTGFTLVEALIAMLILVVGIVGWMAVQDASVSKRGLSRTMTVATELVQSKIEELAEDPAAGSCADYPITYSPGGVEYEIDCSIEMSELTDGNGSLEHANPLWLIEVSVGWQYRGDREYNARRVVME